MTRTSKQCPASARLGSSERLMLQEDADRFVEEARRRNPLDPAVPLGPLIQVMTAPGG